MSPLVARWLPRWTLMEPLSIYADFSLISPSVQVVWQTRAESDARHGGQSAKEDSNSIEILENS